MLRLLLPLSLFPFLAPSAAAQEPATRPAYSLLRQNEDWSVLAGAVEGEDLYDPLKYVPLSDDGTLWASFGGDLGTRFENWSSFNFGAPDGVSHDDSLFLTRARAHADLHYGEHLRAFGELKSSQATDRDLPGGRRALDMDTFEVQQLFVDVEGGLGGEDRLRLRAGRQMLSFGAQRLVSPLPWGNALRTWQGATLEARVHGWTVTGIATSFVPVDKTEPNEVETDLPLYGVYATHSPAKNESLDVYWLYTERPDVTINGTTGDSERHTLGVRHKAPIGDSLDGEVEVSYQLGEVGDGDVNAWSLASQLGFTPSGASTRWFVGLDWASGDEEAGGDVETFDQLYPLGHAYFGIIDAIGRQNILDASFGARWKLPRRTTLTVAGHSFWLDRKSDALYNAGGGASRAPGTFGSSHVGFELDAVASWKIDAHLSAQLGLAHFFAGDALDDSGPSDDVDFAYVSALYSF